MPMKIFIDNSHSAARLAEETIFDLKDQMKRKKLSVQMVQDATKLSNYTVTSALKGLYLDCNVIDELIYFLERLEAGEIGGTL